jgi:hypothetical protein
MSMQPLRTALTARLALPASADPSQFFEIDE